MVVEIFGMEHPQFKFKDVIKHLKLSGYFMCYNILPNGINSYYKRDGQCFLCGTN